MTTIELTAERSLLISYLALRKAIGLLGISLPVVLAIGGLVFFGDEVQGSISAYYYTGMRNVFVGTQWAMGSFLFSYRGYGTADQIAGKLACVAALGIALFPTGAQDGSSNALVGHLHTVSTALFFGALAYFALVLFTKTSSTKPPTPKKLQRNRVYRVCGYTIAACMALLFAHSLLPSESTLGLQAYRPVFALETLAVLAFGLSWLVKGEMLLKDED